MMDAVIWYKRASSHGNDRAKQRLVEIRTNQAAQRRFSANKLRANQQQDSDCSIS